MSALKGEREKGWIMQGVGEEGCLKLTGQMVIDERREMPV